MLAHKDVRLVEVYIIVILKNKRVFFFFILNRVVGGASGLVHTAKDTLLSDTTSLGTSVT